MERTDSKFYALFILFIFMWLSVSCNKPVEETTWPPDLPTANQNGVATLTGSDLLKVPSAVRHILDSLPEVQLTVAKEAPKV